MDELLRGGRHRAAAIVYEELSEAYEENLDETLSYLGVVPQTRSAPALEMHRQADATSEEWVERYQRGEYARRP